MDVKITKFFRNSDRVIDISSSNSRNRRSSSNSRNRRSSSNSRWAMPRSEARINTRIRVRSRSRRNPRNRYTVNRSDSRRNNSRPSRNQSINVDRMRTRQNEIQRCKHLHNHSKYAVTNYKFECCVCYTDKINRKKFLRCNHSLCSRCYDKIILPKKCPLCRLSI